MPVRDKRGAVLFIFVWILVVLSIFVVSLSHNLWLVLKIVDYRSQNTKSFYAAYAGINRLIAELKKDAKENSVDSLLEGWADNKEKFSALPLPIGFATVKYVLRNNTSLRYGARDEESLIDINTAPRALLTALFESTGINTIEAAKISGYVCTWRGDTASESGTPPEEENNFKKAPFSIPEELLAVLEYYYRDAAYSDFRQKAIRVYNNLKDSITVYPKAGEFKINVNTVEENILMLVVKSFAGSSEEVSSAEAVTKAIIQQRSKKGYFSDVEDINGAEALFGTSGDENVFLKAKVALTVQSQHFRIISEGFFGKIGEKITVVYSRPEARILYWHQD